MSKMKITTHKTQRPEMAEALLANQVECTQKACSVYKQEIQQLKAKLKVKTGTDCVVEREKMLVADQRSREAMQRQVKELEKEIRDSEKLLTQADSRKERGVPQLEVLPQCEIFRKINSYYSSTKRPARLNVSRASSSRTVTLI